MSLGQKQELFSRYFAQLLEKIFALGWEVRIGEIWRPQEMQDLYLKTGKSKAKYSKHQDKVAADIYVFCAGKQISSAEMRILGEFWESLDPHNRWGGNFQSLRDEPHFEYNG